MSKIIEKITFKVSSNVRYLILIHVLFIFSCQAGLPELSFLSTVGNIQLNNTSLMLKEKTNTKRFNISGRCDKKVNNLQVSFDYGTTFVDVSNYTTDLKIKCNEDESFNLTFDGNLNSQFSIPQNQNYQILIFRGTTTFGYTNTVAFHITMNNGTAEIGPRTYETSATVNVDDSMGGTISRVYTLKGSISTDSGQPVSSGAYKLEGKIKIK